MCSEGSLGLSHQSEDHSNGLPYENKAKAKMAAEPPRRDPYAVWDSRNLEFLPLVF